MSGVTAGGLDGQEGAAMDEAKTTMRTKRRYAHELYPHPADEWLIRPLAEEVPYLYAQALGLQTWNIGWTQDKTAEGMRRGMDRVMLSIAASQRALIADALLSGLSGDAAWSWAEERCHADTVGEWLWERATKFGINPAVIKPYPLRDELAHHDHMASTGDSMGHGLVTRIECRESECADCCEPEASRG
jgi:hypothetical protein